MIDLTDYLEQNNISLNSENISLEQQAILDVIKMIKNNLNANIYYFYDSIMHYYIYQEGKSYEEIRSHVQDISNALYAIDYILDVFFYDKSSPYHKYIDIYDINNARFRLFEKSKDLEAMNRYKGIFFNEDRMIIIENMLKEDARTDAAKRYFGLDKEI